MKIFLSKTLAGNIIPAYDEDKERLKKFKAGEIFCAEVTKPRNIRFHKKFMALINMLLQNQEIYHDFDHLRKDLIIEAGYYTERANWEGFIVKEAKSISFANMDDTEFDELYNAVLHTIVRCFHFDKQDIIDNVSQFY